METKQNEGLGLVEYVEPAELLKHVEPIFPTQSSLLWYVRRHRAELAQREAFIIVGRRLLFHPVRFSAVVREIGELAAKGGA